MAKSISTIIMDYTNAKKQAAKLEDTAAKLRKLANSDLEGSLNNIKAAWSGDSANLYIQKGRNLKEQILKTASQLESVASTIRRTALNTYNADRKAAELANQKSSSGGGGGS